MARRKHHEFLPAPMCSRCHKPILGVAYRDVRVSTGQSVYDRRHYGWLCNPCLDSVSRHSTVENVA